MLVYKIRCIKAHQDEKVNVGYQMEVVGYLANSHHSGKLIIR